MKTKKSFGLSIGLHVVLIGSVVSLLAMSDNVVEEEIVLELAMSTPESQQKSLSKSAPTPLKSSISQHKTMDTSPKPVLPIEPLEKVVEATVEPVKYEAVVSPQKVVEPQKTEPVVVKKTEPIMLPTPPPPAPKSSVEEEYLDNHLSAIRDILMKYRKYPNAAVRLKQEGELRVTFRLKENGEVEDVRIISGSGYAILDDDAIALIEKNGHYFPKPPKAVRITVPLRYALKNG